VLVVVVLVCVVDTIVCVGSVIVDFTVPENTVTGDGVTVLVWMMSMVLVSVMVEAVPTIVDVWAVAVTNMLVVGPPSGPSRFARALRRASLATTSLERAVTLGVGEELELALLLELEVEFEVEDAFVEELVGLLDAAVAGLGASLTDTIATFDVVHLPPLVTVWVDVMAECVFCVMVRTTVDVVWKIGLIVSVPEVAAGDVTVAGVKVEVSTIVAVVEIVAIAIGVDVTSII
jgi:hypothetical protein